MWAPGKHHERQSQRDADTNSLIIGIRPILEKFQSIYLAFVTDKPAMQLRACCTDASQLDFFSELSNPMFTMRCPDFPNLSPLVYLSLLILRRAQGSD